MDKLQGLNEAREMFFSLYPNAKSIKVDFTADKIKVTPNEEYAVPVVAEDEE